MSATSPLLRIDHAALGLAEDVRLLSTTMVRHVGLVRLPGRRMHRVDSRAFREASPTASNDGAAAQAWGVDTDARVDLAHGDRCTVVRAIARRKAGAPLPRIGLTVFGLFAATPDARALWCSLAVTTLWPGELATAALEPLGGQPVALALVGWIPERVGITSSTVEILAGAVLSSRVLTNG